MRFLPFLKMFFKTIQKQNEFKEYISMIFSFLYGGHSYLSLTRLYRIHCAPFLQCNHILIHRLWEHQQGQSAMLINVQHVLKLAISSRLSRNQLELMVYSSCCIRGSCPLSSGAERRLPLSVVQAVSVASTG